MSHVFVTYFDSNFATRGVAMLHSLLCFEPSARVIVLGIDAKVREILRGEFADKIAVISPEELNAHDAGLGAMGRRTPIETYATTKPALMLYALDKGAPDVTHIDADTWFRGSPAPLFAEIGDASIALSPHRFVNMKNRRAAVGVFNAGYVYARNDETGRRCIADWRADCLAWCYERKLADGRYMNQGYLSCWPQRYPGVHVVAHPGVNLSCANMDGYEIIARGNDVVVDGQALIFFHFHALPPDPRMDNLWQVPTLFGYRQRRVVREAIYRPYLAELARLKEMFLVRYGVTGAGTVRRPQSLPRRAGHFIRRLAAVLLFASLYRLGRYASFMAAPISSTFR